MCIKVEKLKKKLKKTLESMFQSIRFVQNTFKSVRKNIFWRKQNP